MKKTEITKIVKEEYEYISGLITEKKNLEQKLKTLNESVSIEELESLDDTIFDIWEALIGGNIPELSKAIVDVKKLADDENLTIQDLKDETQKANNYLEETNGIGTSLTVKKSAPQNEAVLRKKIFNILKENLLK